MQRIQRNMKLPVFSLILLTIFATACERNEPIPAPNPQVQNTTKPHQPRLNLNTATVEDLMQLPGVGEVLARRIIEYRERHGPFRRPEEIIIIEGFSERKYRAIAKLICVE